ncbi:hypothetical protein BOTBODRAFT_35660 [Botryobasidium botryosum FD-172 SS1]|uniref:Adenylate kinase n=1 Tax=Botryobasidium botryosum (strain FD-172 SS1) TaxID=930990 RepID=A0A067MGV4_BOTB1|nr:hypothetical protein BOTBODRAFT_35660 [Botryobasidium botryosum FD-172 SS1]
MVVPPLLGDGKGNFRIHLRGNCGTGKTTTGNLLSAVLGIPYFALDELFWRPNWGETPRDVFRDKVSSVIEQHESWIIDGNYNSRLGDTVSGAATDVIWLDPPLLLYFSRLVRRSFGRVLNPSRYPPCQEGCMESIRDILTPSDKSILYFALSHHWAVKRFNRAKMTEFGVDLGGKWRRLGGWGREREEWLAAVTKMVKDR